MSNSLEELTYRLCDDNQKLINEIRTLNAENKTLRDALEDVHNWSPDGSNAKNLARAAIKWSDYEPN